MDLLSCTILKATYNIYSYHEDASYLLKLSPTKNDWDDAHVWTLVDVSHPPFGPPTVWFAAIAKLMSMAEIAKLINALSIAINFWLRSKNWRMIDIERRKSIAEKWSDGFQFELGILYIVVEGQGSESFHNENIAILRICLWSWFNQVSWS